MINVDLHFRPEVPVFDATVALGRRHDRRVSVDTAEGTLKAMERAGVERALVYAPHAASYDGRDGNGRLLEMIEGEPSLAPQFACNPTFDDLDEFAAGAKAHGVRSVRMSPALNMYPFSDWVVGPWLQWLEDEKIPLWLFANTEWYSNRDFDPALVHDTIKGHPELKVVLSEVHYQMAHWTYPFLRSLPNVSIEISRFHGTDAVPRLIEAAGVHRVLYGSAFPSEAMGPQLYTVHKCGLGRQDLEAVCGGNLDRLLSGP